MEEKSYVEDIDRSIYDIRDDEKDAYKLKEGLTPDSFISVQRSFPSLERSPTPVKIE